MRTAAAHPRTAMVGKAVAWTHRFTSMAHTGGANGTDLAVVPPHEREHALAGLRLL